MAIQRTTRHVRVQEPLTSARADVIRLHARIAERESSLAQSIAKHLLDPFQRRVNGAAGTS